MLDTNTRIRAFALATLAAGTVFLGSPGTARADDVKPDGKGIVGGALLGGEIVVFVEAIAGVRSGTAYLLGAGGGMVAGGVGGYFVEQAVSDGRAPAYMLAGGLALIIPALVITLDQTRYLPTEGAREDRPVTNLPAADPGKPGGGAVVGAEPAPAPAAPPPTTPPSSTAPQGGTTPAPTPPAGGGTGGNPSHAQGPVSLLNLHAKGRASVFQVGLPVPEVHPTFTATQKKEFAVESHGSEIRIPFVHVIF